MGGSTRDEEEERERRHLRRKAASEKTRLGEREGKIRLIVHRHSNHRNMNSLERVGLSLSGQVFPVKSFELDSPTRFFRGPAQLETFQQGWLERK